MKREMKWSWFYRLNFILIITSILIIWGCHRDDFSGMQISDGDKNSGDSLGGGGEETAQTRLAQNIIAELGETLSSTSSSSRILFQFQDSKSGRLVSQRVLSNSLSINQISEITNACSETVKSAGLDNSNDLILILPEIIKAAQSRLSVVGLTQSADTVNVINVIVHSMVKSLNGRDSFMPSSSAENGLSVKETVLKTISSTSVSYLDEAGLDGDSSLIASEQLVGSIVSSLDQAGVKSSELIGITSRVTSGAVDSLDQITGLELSKIGTAVKNITSGATGAIDEISIQGYSSDNLTFLMIEEITSGATEALGKIQLPELTADN